MAALPLAVVSAEFSVTTTGSPVTLLQLIAPTNQRLKVKEVSVSFKGTSNTASPVLADVLRQTTAGTSGATPTAKRWDGIGSETIQSTAGSNYSAEPTAGDVLISEEVHPQTGFLWQAPYGGEILIPGGGRLGVRVNVGAAVSATARFVYEE